MGEKTVLFLMDALYANDLVDDPPHLKWKMAPFNDQWPASLFASQDGVAVDSVSLDFLRSEWPNLADLSYCDDYMREAALADNPPSKTVYDPEGDGTRLTSLGVHEHWNKPSTRSTRGISGKTKGSSSIPGRSEEQAILSTAAVWIVGITLPVGDVQVALPPRRSRRLGEDPRCHRSSRLGSGMSNAVAMPSATASPDAVGASHRAPSGPACMTRWPSATRRATRASFAASRSTP
jgi:hypothetical protein